jgi:hypothetical protein
VMERGRANNHDINDGPPPSWEDPMRVGSTGRHYLDEASKLHPRAVVENSMKREAKNEQVANRASPLCTLSLAHRWQSNYVFQFKVRCVFPQYGKS